MISQATIHSTNCSSYLVCLRGDPTKQQRCRSLEEAYDLLRRHRVRHAVLAQRVPFDEMMGAPMYDGVSYMPISVPGSGHAG